MENISSKVLVVDENLNFVFASNEAEAFLLFDSKNSEGKGVENIFSEKPSNMFELKSCLLYTSPSPRDNRVSRMPSSA